MVERLFRRGWDSLRSIRQRVSRCRRLALKLVSPVVLLVAFLLLVSLVLSNSLLLVLAALQEPMRPWTL